MTRSILLASMLVMAMALVGCGGDTGNTGGTGDSGNKTGGNSAVKVDPKNPATWAEPFKITEEPEGAVDVIAALADYEADGEEIVLIGRVAEPVKGNYAFYMVDQSLPPCSEECQCPTPWDYCCEPKEKVAAAKILVSFTNDPAKARLALKAGNLPVWRPLDLIRVVGKLKVTNEETGEKMLVATGYFQVERPADPTWEVNWPTFQ